MIIVFTRVLSLIFICQICGIFSQTSEQRNEYCITENFQPSCNAGEVIQMQKALYGRMKTGRCINVDINIGCHSDVLMTLDKQCSGQQSCNFPVLNVELMRSVGCLQEMSPYLEAEYSCVKVYSPSRSHCTSPERIDITGTAVNLASTVSERTSCGGINSPWMVSAKPGQKLNISITDFAWKNGTEDIPMVCHRYGYIIDNGRQNHFSICGERERQRTLYYSTGHEVQIIFNTNDDQRFILHVEAQGCPNMEAPAHATLTRSNDSITVTCQTSDQSWKLRCLRNTWLGIIGTCPPAPTTMSIISTTTSKGSTPKESSKFPAVSENHVVVFVVGCFTLLACTVIIILGVYCTKRYSAKALQSSTYIDDSIGGNSVFSKATPVFYRPVYGNENVRHGSIDLLTHATPVLERRQASCPTLLDTLCEDTAPIVQDPYPSGFVTVPRQGQPVLHYILETPEEEQHHQPEKIYQSLQRDNGQTQLLG